LPSSALPNRPRQSRRQRSRPRRTATARLGRHSQLCGRVGSDARPADRKDSARPRRKLPRRPGCQPRRLRCARRCRVTRPQAPLRVARLQAPLRVARPQAPLPRPTPRAAGARRCVWTCALRGRAMRMRRRCASCRGTRAASCACTRRSRPGWTPTSWPTTCAGARGGRRRVQGIPARVYPRGCGLPAGRERGSAAWAGAAHWCGGPLSPPQARTV
jgi:hypothetical protein